MSEKTMLTEKTEKTKAAVIGSGNIGTDLMIKMLRLSDRLQVAAMVGIDPASDGLARARRFGVPTTADGVEGLIIGQGSPLGEAYTAFQEYARELSRRGVILAVCSKNAEALALEPFDQHPEMVLKRHDLASFKANWGDKATNIKLIAAELNIGLDSLVFIDDNPVERAWVRQELPMVAVPEVSDDPSSFIRALSDGGYFESTIITDEDRLRSELHHKGGVGWRGDASGGEVGHGKPAGFGDHGYEFVWRLQIFCGGVKLLL